MGVGLDRLRCPMSVDRGYSVGIDVSSYRSMRLLAVRMSSMICHVALWSWYPQSGECPLIIDLDLCMKSPV